MYDRSCDPGRRARHAPSSFRCATWRVAGSLEGAAGSGEGYGIGCAGVVGLAIRAGEQRFCVGVSFWVCVSLWLFGFLFGSLFLGFPDFLGFAV